MRDRYHVPGPGRTVSQITSGTFARPAATHVDLGAARRAPLLLIADGKDRIFPAAVTRSSFQPYRASAAVTAYQEFPARSHDTIGEPGWEQVADYALRWAVENGLNGIRVPPGKGRVTEVFPRADCRAATYVICQMPGADTLPQTGLQ